MSTCTMTVDCGPLGEIEWTISYRHHKARRQTMAEPGERETVTIGWIKVGGINGVEVFPSDDFIDSEVIPHCLDDWHGELEAACEAYADAVRQERMERERERIAA